MAWVLLCGNGKFLAVGAEQSYGPLHRATRFNTKEDAMREACPGDGDRAMTEEEASRVRVGGR